MFLGKKFFWRFFCSLSVRVYRHEYLTGKKKRWNNGVIIKMVFNLLQLEEYRHIKLQSFDKNSEVTRRVYN